MNRFHKHWFDFTWLQTSVDLEQSGKPEESLDILFDNLDDLLLSGNIQSCVEFLDKVPVDRLSNAQLLTILTATLPAHSRLPNRGAFFQKVHRVFLERGVSQDDLVGLDGIHDKPA